MEREWTELAERLQCSPDTDPEVVLRRIRERIPKAEQSALIRRWWKYLSPSAVRRHKRMVLDLLHFIETA